MSTALAVCSWLGVGVYLLSTVIFYKIDPLNLEHADDDGTHFFGSLLWPVILLGAGLIKGLSTITDWIIAIPNQFDAASFAQRLKTLFSRSDQISRLEKSVKKELGPGIVTIKKRRGELQNMLEALNRDIRAIEIVRIGSPTITLQCRALESVLQETQTRYEAQLEEVEKWLGRLEEHRQEAEGSVALLRIAQRSRQYPGVDKQYLERLTETSQLIDVCRTIFGRLEHLQSETFCEAGVPIEPAAQTIAANRKKQDELLQESTDLQARVVTQRS